MKREVFGLTLIVIAAMPSLARAQKPGELTPDQKGYIAYDQCMMHAQFKRPIPTPRTTISLDSRRLNAHLPE